MINRSRSTYGTTTEFKGNWQERGVCRTEDPELFFPIGNTGPALAQIDRAKAVCNRCPVIDTCLKVALENDEHGVWGGRSESERQEIVRRKRRQNIGRTAAQAETNKIQDIV